VGWGYQLFFFFFLPVSAELSLDVAAESDVAVVSGVVADVSGVVVVVLVLVEASGVEAGGVDVDGSVVGVVVDGVVCGVVGAGVVWANATPETPTIRAPASVRNFIRYSPVLNGPKRKRTKKPKSSALDCHYIQGIERLTGD
jgi:ADP-ribose pyrophosphatase YjhB (NUDIX family)